MYAQGDMKSVENPVTESYNEFSRMKSMDEQTKVSLPVSRALAWCQIRKDNNIQNTSKPTSRWGIFCSK